jgi:excinuclease ABC subunit C
MGQTTIQEELRAQIERLPRDPGVYMFKDAKGRVIYVGKAKVLRTRVRSYLREGGDGRYHIQFLLKRVRRLEFIVTETEQEALILENNLIKKHTPRYNIFLKDDKTYVNIRLNLEHPFPRLTIVRNPKRDKAVYFGPFASAGSVRATVRMLGKIFPMRTCSDSELAARQRPCLYYYINRCPAPCVGYVDAEAYGETVKKVTMFLKGKGNQLAKSLNKKMKIYAAERRYERAAEARDQLYAVKRTMERQRISSPQSAERDVFGVYRDKERMAVQSLYVRNGKLSGGDSYTFDNAGLTTEEHLSSFLNQFYQRGPSIPAEIVLSEDFMDKEVLEEYLSQKREAPVRIIFPKRGERHEMVAMAVKNAKAVLEEYGGSKRNQEILEDLRDLLELKDYPRRIECFDISNFHGKDAAASRVTFIHGDPAKAQYRHYRVRSVQGANDYGMMEEVLERRIARGIREGDLPDLLMVDGGRGQLNIALKVLDRLGVEDLEVLGIAKVRDGSSRRRIRGRERIYTPRLPEGLLLDGNSPPLLLLERIRDEAHRFAITYHKKLRSRRIRASRLDGIPGIGPVRRRRLLAAFGSVEKLSKADIAQITSVRGISRDLAARLKDFLGHQS